MREKYSNRRIVFCLVWKNAQIVQTSQCWFLGTGANFRYFCANFMYFVSFCANFSEAEVIGANIRAFPCLSITFFWVLHTRWWIHWIVWWSWWVRPMRQNRLHLRHTFLDAPLISLNRLQTLGFCKIIFSYSTFTWNKSRVKRENRIWSITLLSHWHWMTCG